MAKILLNVQRIRQSDTLLCWQAVTNMFSNFYNDKDYFIGPHGDNRVGDVEEVINLAISDTVLDLRPDNYTGIVNAIKAGKLIYACLDYGNSSHATVIAGVDELTEKFWLIDPDDGRWHCYVYEDRNASYIDDTTGQPFKIYKMAAPKRCRPDKIG